MPHFLDNLLTGGGVILRMSDLDLPCTLATRSIALKDSRPREPVTKQMKVFLAVDPVQWSCMVLCDPNPCHLVRAVNANVLQCQAFLIEL
jgi:hypothetical protein